MIRRRRQLDAVQAVYSVFALYPVFHIPTLVFLPSLASHGTEVVPLQIRVQNHTV